MMMSVEQSVELLAGETGVLGENMPLFRFVHHKSHMTCQDSNPGPSSGRPANNPLSYVTAFIISLDLIIPTVKLPIM
jgi:hypothetical protein